MEDSSDDDDLPFTPGSHKKRRLASSDESDDDTGLQQSKGKSGRTSERLREKGQRRFQMPSRRKVFDAIPDFHSPSKGISQLKPRKLVNDFTRVRHRYNHDPDYTDSEESLGDFIVGDDYEDRKPATKTKPKKGGRVRNKPPHTHRIQALPSSSSDSDTEPLQPLSQSSAETATPPRSARPADAAVAPQKASCGAAEDSGNVDNGAAAASQAAGWKGRLRARQAKDSGKPTLQRKGKAKSAPLKSSPVDSPKKSKESPESSDEESEEGIGPRRARRHTELDSESSDSESSDRDSENRDSEIGDIGNKPGEKLDEAKPGKNGDNPDSEPDNASSGASSKIEEFSSSEESDVQMNSAGHPIRKVVVVREYEKYHKFDDLKNLRKQREKRLSSTEKKTET